MRSVPKRGSVGSTLKLEADPTLPRFGTDLIQVDPDLRPCHLQLPNGGMLNSLLQICCAPVAQRLEQQTHNLLVRGSNPCGGTKQLASCLALLLLIIITYRNG